MLETGRTFVRRANVHVSKLRILTRDLQNWPVPYVPGNVGEFQGFAPRDTSR